MQQNGTDQNRFIGATLAEIQHEIEILERLCKADNWSQALDIAKLIQSELDGALEMLKTKSVESKLSLNA